jgi:DNA helicase-4
LSDPLRRGPHGLTLQDSGIAVRGGARNWIAFDEIASKPTTRNGMLSSSLAIALTGDAQVALPAVRAAAASSFAEALSDAWSQYNLRALAAEDGTIQRLLLLLDALRAPERYPSACDLDPVAREAAALTARVLSKLNAEAVGPETMRRIAPITAFACTCAQNNDNRRAQRADGVFKHSYAEGCCAGYPSICPDDVLSARRVHREFEDPDEGSRMTSGGEPDP